MKTVNFSFPNLLIIVITLIIIVFSVACVNQIRQVSNESPLTLIRGISLYLAGIVLFCLLCIAGVFSDLNSMPPKFPLFFLFNFTFMFLLLFNKKAMESLLSIPCQWFLAIQSCRLVLEVVLHFLFLDQIVPKAITFHGQSVDIVVGLAALPVSYLVYKNWRNTGIAFNVFGLLSLANIIFLAIFSFPTPFRIYDLNYLPTYFPGILVPLFIAPMAIFFHIISLKQLLNRA